MFSLLNIFRADQIKNIFKNYFKQKMNEAAQELILETVALPISTVGFFRSIYTSKVRGGKYVLWTVGMMAFVGITAPSLGHAVFRMGITLLGSILTTLTDNFLGNISTLIIVSLILHKLLFTSLEEEHALNFIYFIEQLVKRKESEDRKKREEAEKKITEMRRLMCEIHHQDSQLEANDEAFVRQLTDRYGMRFSTNSDHQQTPT